MRQARDRLRGAVRGEAHTGGMAGVEGTRSLKSRHSAYATVYVLCDQDQVVSVHATAQGAEAARCGRRGQGQAGAV